MSEVDGIVKNGLSAQAEYNRRDQLSDICQIIEKSAELAVGIQDYLSFATVIDINIGDPKKFSPDEATVILGTLYKVLATQTVICYQIGWDMLELFLKYVDQFSTGVDVHQTQKPFKIVMGLFSLLCENANHGELMLRACELMLQLESERNIQRLAAMTLDEKTLDSAVANVSIDANPGFDINNSGVRHENIKFCVLFEVIRFSLLRVKTSYPSSYLLEAASTLLQVADDPNADLLSVSTYGRRMYLLARDFDISGECEVSEEEMIRVRNLLINFVSYAADLLVRRYSLKWAERLYVQMRHKMAMAPPAERQRLYSETEYTRRMSEVMSRMAQLMLSYDIDPETVVHDFMGCTLVDSELVEMPSKLPDTSAEGVEILTNNNWASALVKGLSISGLSVLKTQIHFDSVRRVCNSVRLTMEMTLYIGTKMSGYACYKDIMLYWSLFLSNFFNSDKMKEVSESLLQRYLDLLIGTMSDSDSREEQFVTGSIVARALRFQTSDFSYNFCINVMKTSNSPAAQFIAVDALKCLVTGKICSSDNYCISTQKSIELTPERRREVAQVSRDAIRRLQSYTNRFPCYYLNLLTVVPTDKDIVLEICDDIVNTCSGCRKKAKLNSSCLMQLDILATAVDQLREYANTFDQ